MNYRKLIMIKLKSILTPLLILISYISVAGDEIRNSRIYADQLASAPSAFIQTQDDKWTGLVNWTSGFSNYSNMTIVELGIDESKHLPLTTSKICATFNLQLTDAF